MTLKEAKKRTGGLDYLLLKLDLQSGVGRERLSQTPWFSPGEEASLYTELERVERLRSFMAEGATVLIDKIKLKFSQIWDIRNTFTLIAGDVVDDVQLFEVKRFALLCGEARGLLDELVKTCAFHPAPSRLPSLEEVVKVLDPRGERLATFHIYSEYDEELARLRKVERTLATPSKLGHAELRLVRSKNDEQSESFNIERQARCEEIEREVREKLCKALRPHLSALREAMDTVAYWDLLIAKADLALKYNLTLPVLKTADPKEAHTLCYEGLFNPMVKEILEESGHRYQAVDVCLKAEPTLLTGANMSGKTVLLKTLALSQCLLQFGFSVPAASASLPLFNEVELLVSDEQDEGRGLSSFGAEIQRLNRVFSELDEGMNLLLLIDEPARTTNPNEGKALVCALLDKLVSSPCMALVSTHYGPIPNPVRRLRVRGFVESKTDFSPFKVERTLVRSDRQAKQADKVERTSVRSKKEQSEPNTTLDIKQIQNQIDYSLVEEQPDAPPPAEALRIAALLGFDAETLSRAQEYYKNQKQ